MKTISKLLLCFLFLSSFMACGGSKESKMIEATVAEVNKQCPMQIDIVTTLEKVKFESPKTIQYHYKLDFNQIDTNVEDIKKAIDKNIRYNMVNNKDLDALKEIGTTFKYFYKNQEGKDLFDFTFGPDLYNSKEFGQQENENVGSNKIFEILQQSADLQNQQLPKAINEAIDMYEVKAILPRTIEYVYRYRVERQDLDTAYLASKRMRNELVYEISKDNADKMLKDNDVTFRFTYCDKEGNPLRTIDVAPEDYK